MKAFSTNGCKVNRGTCQSRQLSSTFKSKNTRSVKRVCCIWKYLLTTSNASTIMTLLSILPNQFLSKVATDSISEELVLASSIDAILDKVFKELNMK